MIRRPALVAILALAAACPGGSVEDGLEDAGPFSGRYVGNFTLAVDLPGADPPLVATTAEPGVTVEVRTRFNQPVVVWTWVPLSCDLRILDQTPEFASLFAGSQCTGGHATTRQGGGAGPLVVWDVMSPTGVARLDGADFVVDVTGAVTAYEPSNREVRWSGTLAATFRGRKQ